LISFAFNSDFDILEFSVGKYFQQPIILDKGLISKHQFFFSFPLGMVLIYHIHKYPIDKMKGLP